MGILVDNDTLLGVEIEFERSDRMVLRSSLDKYWRVEGDGSLRLNGAEIVFQRPLAGDDVVEALERAQAVTRKCLFSNRCGLHVHINMREMPAPVLREFLFIYILFEPLLLGFCGADRENNNFCVPTYTNKSLLRKLGSRTPIVEIGHDFQRNDLRYAALNLASVVQHGSLEFRAMRGTADTSVLFPWINMLLSILKYAKGMPNLLEMVEHSSTDVGNMLLNDVFGAELADILYEANRDGYQEKLLAGGRALQYVLRCNDSSKVTCNMLGKVAVAPKKVRAAAPTPGGEWHVQFQDAERRRGQ